MVNHKFFTTIWGIFVGIFCLHSERSIRISITQMLHGTGIFYVHGWLKIMVNVGTYSKQGACGDIDSTLPETNIAPEN